MSEYAQGASEHYGETKDNARVAGKATVDAVRSAGAALSDNFRAIGENSKGGAAQTRENIRSTFLGPPDSQRARVFRRAKAATSTAGVKLTPDNIDAAYTKNVGKAAAAEFLATLLFVLISAGSVASFSTFLSSPTTNAAALLAIALAHGIALALTVNLAAPYSGGHLNPAVTFAFIVTGRIDALAGLVYWIAQLVGAFLGAFLLWTIFGLKGALGAHALGAGVSSWGALGVEIILTALLTLTVWSTAVDPRGNKTMAPYFIGLSVFVAVIFGANLTGPSLNPARTFGPALVSGTWAHHWVYWLGPFIGAAIAALYYEFAYIRTTDNTDTDNDEIYEEIRAGEEGRA